MAYLTQGKREVVRQGYQAQVNTWAKVAQVPPPLVKVRQVNVCTYNARKSLITMNPDAGVESLLHEFAHHLAWRMGVRGHGPLFRIALVAAATIHYGLPNKYNWNREYKQIQSWALRNKLMKEVTT